jgi:predicted permease
LLEVLGITAPIFCIIGMGYLAARFSLLSREQMRGLGTFVITFAMPALVIRALALRPIAEVLNPHYLIAYVLASLGCLAVGLTVFRKVHGHSLSNSAIAGMGMGTSNSGFIGYPIALMAVGPQAGVALALGMMVENLVMIPLALALAEAGHQGGGSTLNVVRETFKRLSRNPLILAIIAGGILSIAEVKLPVVPLKLIEMLSMASAPVALFVIGGVLYGTKVRGQLGEIAQIGAGKLILHPLLLSLGFLILADIEPAMMTAGLIMASAPMMSVYPILGQRFGLEGRCAAALVITTLTSFITISLLLIFVKH